MIDRREFLRLATGAGASLALTPELLRATPRAELIQRAIPSTGEMLPVISFSPREAASVGVKTVLKAFVDNGGRVVDTLHSEPPEEQAAVSAARELGIQGELFWTTALIGAPPRPPGDPPPPKADAAALRAQIETSLARFNVPRIDLVLTSAYNVTHDPTFLGVLREMKNESIVRYIGVRELATPPYPPDDAFGMIEAIMRSEQIDVVATDYTVGWRGVEKTILPLALERKIGFMAYFPFDRGRLFERASSTPLPEWAAEFDARTWAQFFLKYVLGHPAVIVARTGTTDAAHMVDNIGGGVGRLPNEPMRKRMAELVDSLPPRQPPRSPAPPTARERSPVP